MREEETIGGGMGAAIFLMPLVFGWMVLRSAYHPAIRIVVGVYMALSLIALCLIVSMFWTSGSDIKSMARDFDKNRSVAAQNAGTAKAYMDQYEAGDLGRTPSQNIPADRPAEVKGTFRTNSVTLAREVEKDGGLIGRLTGKTILISGQAAGDSRGQRAYLTGTDMYPAIILEYEGTPPAQPNISATCTAARMESAGPVLSGCR